MHEVEGRSVATRGHPEIIAKNVYYRKSEATPRDIFDITAAARTHFQPAYNPGKTIPEKASRTRRRLKKLSPEFVERTIQ
jgi:hypothetical protein